MKAIFNPLESHKEFVLPEDFRGFHPDRIEQIRQAQKDRKVRTDMCIVRDSEQLKSVLIYRLKKMGFVEGVLTPIAETNKLKHGTYKRLARQTGIPANIISAYFNHNRYIWNESKGRSMSHISETQLFILCLFVGVKLSLDIELEPLELIQ